MDTMSRKRKLFLTSAVVGVVGAIAVFGTYAAFTDTTTNAGNSISSGTVKLDDNDAGVALYNVTDKKPGDTAVKCIKVDYTGSLAASVKLYVSAGITSGTLYNLKVERGGSTTDFNTCAGFAATSTAYDAALGSFPTSYATGIDGKAAGAAWTNGGTEQYRVTVTQNDDTTVGAHRTVTTSGAHTFTWEARNN